MTDFTLVPKLLAPDPVTEQPHSWSIDIETDQYKFALDLWTDFTINWNHDGATVSVEVNLAEPMIGYIRDLITDLVFKRDHIPLFRFRVLSSQDAGSRDSASTTFTCATYETILSRRIIYEDWVLQQVDVDAAWTLVQYTQTQLGGDLGITRAAPPVGTQRQRTLSIGTTIRDAITDFATDPNGFDWWIDVDKQFHCAKPRRGEVITTDQWMYGAEVAELTRTNPTDEYASDVLTIGARNETRIPDGVGGDTVYPPPDPQHVTILNPPFGLWSSGISYSDVVTVGSLAEKADFELRARANIRPYYRFTLAPGVWNPPIGLGDIITFRVQFPPRADLRVPIRIEEMEFACTVDGAETVSVVARAEEPETFISGSPLGPIPVDPLLPAGRTPQYQRLRPWDDLGATLKNIDKRVSVGERAFQHAGAGGAGNLIAGTNVVIDTSNPAATRISVPGPVVFGTTGTTANVTLTAANATEGGQIDLANSDGTAWTIDSYTNSLRMFRAGVVGFNMPDPGKIMVGSGGWYVGYHPGHGAPGLWRADQGANPGTAYTLLAWGNDTLVNSDSGAIGLRVNNSTIATARPGRFDVDVNSLYFPGGGGGWNMSDSTYLRATNNKVIYTAGQVRGDGGLQCGSNYMVVNINDPDSGLYWWSEGYVGLVSNGLGVLTVQGTTVTVYNTVTVDGYRITSNGGYNGAWQNGAFLAQKYSGGDRTHYGMHPGGVAKSMGMMTNNAYVQFWNEDASWYASLYANDIVQASQRRGKQDIASWPPQSAGSAVMGAASRLSLIDVVSYRIKPEHGLIQAETMALHDCDVDDCDGTSTDPCQRVQEWDNPMIGVIVEDLATVLPEAVGLDPDGNPGGMRMGSMVGYLLAVCKEQQERIESLEHHLEAS